MKMKEIKAGGFIKRTFYPAGCGAGGGSIIKMNKDEYLVRKTGELKKYKTASKSRFENKRAVVARCEAFKWKIRANSANIKLFVTLTYTENMTDTKRLYQDFRKFWQRLQYNFPQITGYLVAFEPQERGAWHAHILLLSNKGKNLFIENDKIAELWGFGFTKTLGVKKINDLGSYLTSYLVKNGSDKSNKLERYPAQFRFLRWSKGLKDPEITVKRNAQMEKIDNYIKTFEQTLIIENNNYSFKIIIQEFRKKTRQKFYKKTKYNKKHLINKTT